MMKTGRSAILILLTAVLYISCAGGGGADSPVTNNPPGDGTPDITAPAPGNGGIITAGSVTANSLVLNWGAATDAGTAQLNLSYAVYQSTSNNINTVENCEKNGKEIQQFTTGSLTKTVSGLSANSDYYFNVIVKDSAGNKASYSIKQQSTNGNNDTTPPSPGSSGALSTGSVTYNSLVVLWDPANDNITAQSDLQYAVYWSKSNNINTVTACEVYGTKIDDYAANITSKTVTGLEGSTTYYFNVVVRDSAGQKAVYVTKSEVTSETPDTTPPVPGNSGNIYTSEISYSSVTLSWEYADDNITAKSSLEYALYESLSANISTVEDCENNGTRILNFTSNLYSILRSGLTSSRTYYYNVVVRDSAQNKAAYTMRSVTTTVAPDTIPPTPGNSGIITAGSATNNSIVVNWSAADDAVTGQSDLLYLVYQSSINNINSVNECVDHGTPIGVYTANITSVTVSGLSVNTGYYFNVVVKDSAGNRAAYNSKQLTTVLSVPSAANIISLNGAFSLSWKASLNAVSYQVWLSATENASTATQQGGDITSNFYIINGLNNGTKYYVWLKTKYPAGTSEFGAVANGIPSLFSLSGTGGVAGNSQSFNLGGLLFNLKYVPGGTFPTGTGTQTLSTDAGANPVTIDRTYWMAETEITQGLWNAVYVWAIDSARGAGRYTFSGPSYQGDGSGATDQIPAVGMNWRDSMIWCNALTEYYNANNGTDPDLDCVYYTDSAYNTPIRRATYSSTVSENTPGSQDCPYIKAAANSNIDMVNCTARGFRLPGVMEWECAARYKNGSTWTAGTYASGAAGDFNNITETLLVAWWEFNSSNINIVKEKASNALGIYDMSGNAGEWCFDWNPAWHQDTVASTRLIKGGSYTSSAYSLQVGAIGDFEPDFQYYNLGFRVARSE